MEAIIRWQPYVDGNKRSALAVVSVYLWINGYTLILPLSAVRFTVQIAKAQTPTQDEIQKLLGQIANWLRRHSAPRNSRWVRIKLDLYLTLPVFILHLAFRLHLRWVASAILDRWFAFDIYPEHKVDAKKMTALLLALVDSNLEDWPRTRTIRRIQQLEGRKTTSVRHS